MVHYKVSAYIAGHGYTEYVFTYTELGKAKAQEQYDYLAQYVEQGFVWDLDMRLFWLQ